MEFDKVEMQLLNVSQCAPWYKDLLLVNPVFGPVIIVSNRKLKYAYSVIKVKFK